MFRSNWKYNKFIKYGFFALLYLVLAFTNTIILARINEKEALWWSKPKNCDLNGFYQNSSTSMN